MRAIFSMARQLPACRAPEPAVALLRVAAVKAEAWDRVERLRRYLARLLDRRLMPLDLSLDEVAQAVLERNQAFREREIHCCGLGAGGPTRPDEHFTSRCDLLDLSRHFFDIRRQARERTMRAFPQNPMTDGMAWSGFDRAAANIPGGADVVFRAVGVSQEIVDRPGMRATFRQYVGYFDAMARICGDPDFGHRFGLRTHAARSGIPGHLILNARRFRDGVLDLARTLPTLAEGLGLELVEDRDPPALLWAIAPDAGDGTQFMWFAQAYLVRMLQAHRGTHWHPRRILTTLPPPRRPKLYAMQLGCPLVFNAPINAVEIERRDLYAVRRGIDRHIYALLTTYADHLLTRAPQSENLCDAVASTVRDGLAQGRHDFNFVAERLGKSKRSLQRRIAASGTTFGRIRDDVRHELATSLLTRSNLSIGEIAYRLGYSEIAAFTHAFNRWSGKSPQMVRSLSMRST
jgi:AraC-like DNA-binding protein